MDKKWIVKYFIYESYINTKNKDKNQTMILKDDYFEIDVCVDSYEDYIRERREITKKINQLLIEQCWDYFVADPDSKIEYSSNNCTGQLEIKIIINNSGLYYYKYDYQIIKEK